MASLLICSSSVHADTLLSNTFDADIEGWGTDDHWVTQSDGQLVVIDDGGAGATRAFSNFDTPVTLALGEQLTFTSEVIFTSTGLSVQRALNIAISNGAGTPAYVNRISAGGLSYDEGHYFNSSLDAAANNLVLDGTIVGGLLPAVSSIRANFNDFTYSHTITFTLARSDATTLVLTTTAELGDGTFRTFTATDTAATNFTFSRVDVGTFGNSNYDFNLDDVSVETGPIPAPSTSITAVSYDATTGNVKIRFVNQGAAVSYTVESDADLDFSAGVTEYPLDGSEDTLTYPGEIEFSFVDATATGTSNFWRVRTD